MPADAPFPPCDSKTGIERRGTELAKGTPTDWANESHAVAIASVYKDVPADGPPPKLDQKYVDASGAVIDLQLQRGGVRLATILNGLFK